MIWDLSDFRWPQPIKADPEKRDRSRKCVYHKDHGHTTKQCKSLHCLVEIVRPLRGKTLSQAPTNLTAPRTVINYIHGSVVDEKYNFKWKRQMLLRVASVREQVSSIQPDLPSGGTSPIDGVITFPLVDPNQVLQPHEDAWSWHWESSISM